MSLVPLVFKSTDAGAPQLTGQVGSLVALLDAVLVSGYGVGTESRPGAGWALAFSGLNKRVYRNDPALFSGAYLRVDDSNTVAGSNARAAHVRAFETMTEIDAGQNGAPTVAELANGDTWTKSLTLNAVIRPWVVIATAKWFYLFVDIGDYGMRFAIPQFAGDLDSFVPGDRYAFCVSSGLGGGPHSGGSLVPSYVLYATSAFYQEVTAGRGAYILRAASGVVGAVSLTPGLPRTTNSASATTSSFGGGGGAYPSVISGGLFAEEVLMRERANVARGRLPNCYAPLHPRPFDDMSLLVGLSGFEGGEVFAKSYRGGAHSQSNNDGQVLFDLTTPVV